MRRRLLPLLLALSSGSWAEPPEHVELTVTPAWKGWSRPGRVTELDVRVGSDKAGPATLVVQAGAQTLRSALQLVPGRLQQLRLPLLAAPAVTVQVSTPDGVRLRQELVLSRAEVPVLAVALAAQEPLALAGFHTVAVVPDDLPRKEAAYASIDALVVDATSLGALDPAQLSALLAHAAGCGRIVVVNQDERVRRMLDAAAGCSGQALMHATRVDQAPALLTASLDRPLAAVAAPQGIADGDAPALAVWRSVAVFLACALAAGALSLLFSSSAAALLGLPALSAVAALALLQWMPAAAQLSIWSQADSGAPLARYQARQLFPGTARGTLQVPLPSLLAASAQACDATAALQLDVDPRSGLASAAAFETRLFHQFSMCYSGTFPISRALAVTTLDEAQLKVSNTATQAWPAGHLLLPGQVHALPALAPGGSATLAATAGRPASGALERAALALVDADHSAALWVLDLSGVSQVPAGSRGWLLVSAAAP